MPSSPANARSRRSVSRGRSPNKKQVAKKTSKSKSPTKKVSKSKSPTKKQRATSKTPKKTRGRSKSVTKTPAKKTPARSSSRARSKTPSRKSTPAAKKTTKSPISQSASAIKVSVKKLASSVSKSAKSLAADYTPASNGRNLRKRFDHSVGAESGSGHTKAKPSTVGSLLASVRGYQSPSRRGRSAHKWYMFHGYNVPLLAFFFAILIVVFFSGYHYRHDVSAQINRLRARGVHWYNK